MNKKESILKLNHFINSHAQNGEERTLLHEALNCLGVLKK